MKTVVCSLVFPAVISAMLATSPAVAATTSQVAPGKVVRWPGDGLTECRSGERSWAPLDGACWYPVDLLSEAGTVRLERVRDGRLEARDVAVAAYPYPVQELQVEPRMVELSPEDLERDRREKERIGALWARPGPARFRLPLAHPLAAEPSGGNFGSRRIFNGQPRSPHSGVDYKAPRGTEVLSVAAGVVVLAEEHYFAGNSVFVDHGDGLVSMYFHLEEIRVEPGQEVDRGEPVGTVGSTGRATGPHLHFGLRWHTARIDPTPLIGSIDAVAIVE